MPNSEFSAGETRFVRKSPLRSGSLFASTYQMHRPRFNILYILILGKYSKFCRKDIFLALSNCFRKRAQALAAGLPRQNHVYITADESFRVTIKNSMKCLVNWNSLRICVRSRNTQAYLKCSFFRCRRKESTISFQFKPYSHWQRGPVIRHHFV